MNVPSILRPLAVVFLAAAILVIFSGRPVVTGKPFAFQAEDFDGQTVTNWDLEFENKVIVLDIWGTWCPPCRAEIPHLNSLYDSYREQGLEVVGVAFEHEPDRRAAIAGLRRFISEYRMEYTVLYGGTPDTSSLSHVFPDLGDFQGFPTTIVIDRKGLVREVTVGFAPDLMGKLEAAVKDALAGS